MTRSYRNLKVKRKIPVDKAVELQELQFYDPTQSSFPPSGRIAGPGPHSVPMTPTACEGGGFPLLLFGLPSDVLCLSAALAPCTPRDAVRVLAHILVALRDSCADSLARGLDAVNSFLLVSPYLDQNGF